MTVMATDMTTAVRGVAAAVMKDGDLSRIGQVEAGIRGTLGP